MLICWKVFSAQAKKQYKNILGKLSDIVDSNLSKTKLLMGQCLMTAVS